MAQARRTLAVLTPDYLTANYTRIELESAVIDDPTGVLGTLLASASDLYRFSWP